jgi:hypothetical protein
MVMLDSYYSRASQESALKKASRARAALPGRAAAR